MKFIISMALAAALAGTVIAETIPTPEELEREVASYTELLRKDGANARYLNALGFAYYRLNRINDAMDAFQRAVAADAGYAVTFNNIGAIYLSQGDFARAETAFRSTLRLDPGYVKAAYNLAVALYRQGKYFRAYSSYVTAKQLDPVYVKKRSSESRGRDELREEIKRHPGDPRLKEIEKELMDDTK